MNVAIDLAVLGLIAGITYALMSEGLWGAALMFFNVLFAALISFNFYEPVAQLIVTQIGNETVSSFADCVSLMLLFIIPLVLMRLATETITPSMVRFPMPLYHLGRVIFGLGTAFIVMGMLILGYQAAPVQKRMLGVMEYDYVPFYKERFDKDFLAFFQYTSGYTFARNGAGESDPLREFPAKPMLFDPEAMWLLNHQASRPYGTETILREAPDPAAASGTTPAGGAPGAGMPGPGMPAPAGPGIPGGTAGAAAGLAPTTP